MPRASNDCVACDALAPFGIASERRRMDVASLVETFKNTQEQVDVMERTLEKKCTILKLGWSWKTLNKGKKDWSRSSEIC